MGKYSDKYLKRFKNIKHQKITRKTGLLFAACVAAVLLCPVMVSCSKRNSGEEKTGDTKEPESSTAQKEVKPRDGYYKPNEFGGMNLSKSSSKWCWQRSAESEHFIVFWEKGFGDDPNSPRVALNMRVDIDDLLKKAERFYSINAEQLGFEPVGYKIQIYLLYQTEWLATGAGYDNKAGALWVNPSTCHPVGSTIAHEIGHTFQYMIYCNQIASGMEDNYQSGFRYGYPESNGGNGFWEQTAQWQSLVAYPNEIFTGYHMDTWFNNYNRAFEHEWIRYQSYWLFFYLTDKHGNDTVSRIWKESRYPEDALSCYTRLYLDGDVQALYDVLYDYASKMATFDIDVVRDYAEDWRERYRTVLYDTEDGYRQAAYSSCPGVTGFNVIRLDIPGNIPGAGKKISVDFAGLGDGAPLNAADEGSYMKEEKVVGKTDTYNKTGVAPSWRFGFVALLDDGSRVYGDMNRADMGSAAHADFDVPENAVEVYMVVLGAAEKYVVHPWDENDLNDAQAPYKVRITGSDIYYK